MHICVCIKGPLCSLSFRDSELFGNVWLKLEHPAALDAPRTSSSQVSGAGATFHIPAMPLVVIR